MKVCLLILPVVLLCGCGSDGSTEVVPSAPEIPEITLSITDTIGVELGDTCYVFGFAADVVRTDSILYVLDMPYATVKKYGSDGTYLGSFGRHGDGPGEMVFPQSLELLPGGTMLVQDVNDLNMFDLSGQWLGFALEHRQNWPRQHAAADSSSFVIIRHEFIHEPERISREFIAMYDLDGSMLQEYNADSVWLPVDPEDNTDALNITFFSHYFTADPDRNVYLVTRHQPGYAVECFGSGGNLFRTLTLDIPIVDRTAEEILMEKEYIEDYLTGMGTSNVMQWVYDPDPFKEPIAGIWLGWGGNLWVLRGADDRPNFDVWSVPDGELLYRAVLDVELPLGQYFTFYITPWSKDFAVVHEDEGMVQRVLLVDASYPSPDGEP